MERLTEWGKDKKYAHYPRCFEECEGLGCTKSFCEHNVQVCNRLAAYEDTGLEPEEIKANMEMFAAYRHVCGGLSPEKVEAALRRMAENDKAREEGRLVVLPCKVGDTVYAVTRERLQDMKKSANEQPKPFLEVREHTISTIVINNTGVRAFANSYCLYLGEFGKTVFLTRAEAERALEVDKHETD